ncbi:MAG: LysM peptidoglycan-binding domain-containing protein [Planctomycetota bacterium]|jgi:hypothetical protein
MVRYDPDRMGSLPELRSAPGVRGRARLSRTTRVELPPYYAERLHSIRPATAVSVRRKAVELGSEAEAARLFRDFKLGLLTLVIVALLLLAYFWDGGRERPGAAGDREEGVLTMQLRGERRSEAMQVPAYGRSQAEPDASRPARSQATRPAAGPTRRGGRSPSPRAAVTGGAARPGVKRTFVYTVRRGDTLSGIALRLYGDAGDWRSILAANRDKLRRASDLRPAMSINIPARQSNRR